MASPSADVLVALGLDPSAYERGLKKAGLDVHGFAGVVAEASKRIEHLFEFEVVLHGAERFAEFVKGGAEAGEQILIMSQKVGVSVEQMSRLDFAAKMVGSSGDHLAHLIPFLGKAMSEAAEGTGMGASAFKVLGVQAADAEHRLRPTEDVLLEIAQKFSGFEDGAAKGALAMALFGKHGADMIPFLNKGKAGIEELMEEADRLGKTMSQEVAEGAALFNENLKKLEGGSKLLAASVAAELAPAFTLLLQSFTDGARGADAMKTGASMLADGLKVVAGVALAAESGIASIASRFRYLIDLRSEFWKAWDKGDGDYSGMDRLTNKLESSLAKDEELYRRRMEILGFGAQGTAPYVPAGPDPYDRATQGRVPEKSKGPAFDMDAMKKQADAVERITEEINKLRDKAATMGMGESAALLWSVQFGALANKLKETGNAAGGLRARLLDAIGAEGAAQAQLDLDKRGAEGWKALTTEVEKTSTELLKNEGATNAARLQWELANGSLGKSVEAARASAKGWEELWLVESKVQQLRDNATGLDHAAGAKGLTDALDKLRDKTRQVGIETERGRVEFDLARGDLKKYVDELGGPTALAAERFRAALLLQADAYDKVKQRQEAIRELGSAIEESLTSAFDGGRIDEAFASMLKRLAVKAASQEIMIQLGFESRGGPKQGLTGLLGQFFGGPSAGSASALGDGPDPLSFFGGRASGGPVDGGTPYLIGERGPELFVPSVSGTVVPNHALGGSSTSVALHFSALDGASMGDWWDRNETEILRKINRAVSRGRVAR